MRLLLLLLLMAATAVGEERGVTALPIKADSFQGTPCKRLLRMFRGVDYVHSAVLWDTFGHNRTCLRKLLKLKAKHITLEIHPTCGPCRRSPNWPLQPIPANPSVLRRVTNFAKRYANEKRSFLLSLELEDQFGNREASDVYARVRESWPYEIVRNSIHRIHSSNADYIELHGKAATCPIGGNHIADLDGDSLSWSDVQQWLERNKDCRFARIWQASWQGIPDGQFRPLNQRSYSISRLDVREVRRLLNEN